MQIFTGDNEENDSVFQNCMATYNIMRILFKIFCNMSSPLDHFSWKWSLRKLEPIHCL